MGQANQKKKRNEQFLVENPWCCLCGGAVKATTIEHAPPKVFFIDKILPSGTHRVPACKRCNNGSSQYDQVAALAALTMASAHRTNIPQGYINKIMTGVKNNSPTAFKYFSENIELSKSILLKINGWLHNGNIVEVDSRIYDEFLNPWATKQALALFYLHSGNIVPTNAVSVIFWYPNTSLVEGMMPQALIHQLPEIGKLEQGGQNSDGTFIYRYKIENEISCFCIFMYDSSAVVISIFNNASVGRKFVKEGVGIFSTNEDQGIHPYT